MLAWIGKIMASSFVNGEIQKIKEHLDSAVQQVGAMKAMKQELYQMADKIMAEGQAYAGTKSKEEIDAWFSGKRAQLKTWSLS